MGSIGNVLDIELLAIREEVKERNESLDQYMADVEDRVAALESRTVYIPKPEVRLPEVLSPGLNFSREDMQKLHGILLSSKEQHGLTVQVWNAMMDMDSSPSVEHFKPESEMTYLQQEGRRSALKGARAEASVVQVLNNHERRPGWLLESRACTEEEDARGIDVVVNTDIGEIYIQVKSSKSNAQKFLRKYPQRNVGMAIIRPQDDRETVYNKAIDAVAKQRSEILKACRAGYSERKNHGHSTL